MKIICDSCGAKYSIAHEKVQGKVFKIRCKRCSEVIVVRGSDAGAEEQGETDYSSAYGESAGAAEWYVVIDGERVGPITVEEVEGYFGAGQLHGETFAWRDGLEDWVMLNTLSEFDHLTQDIAGPEDATIVASRDSIQQGLQSDQAAYAATGGFSSESGGADYSSSDYSGGYSGGFEEEAGEDATMVMDSALLDRGAAQESMGDLGGGGAGASSSVEISDYSGAEEDPFGAVSVESDGPGYDEGGGYDAVGGGYDEGGSYGGGDSYDDGGAYEDSGGYDAGGGMFAAFDSSDPEESDYGSESYDEPAAISPDLGGGEESNLVGARNENSVLFSLSSVDQVKAVSGQSSGDSGQAAGNDKSGLIDIQALASTHAAMSGRDDKKSDDDEFVAGTMSMPALMPMGTKKSNTGLIIGVSVGAAVLVIGLVAVIAVLLLKDSGPEEGVNQQVVAVAEPEEEEEEELSAEEIAAAAEAEAAAQAALEGNEKEEEEEEEVAEEEEEEEEKKEEKAVAQRSSSRSSGSSGSRKASPSRSSSSRSSNRGSSASRSSGSSGGGGGVDSIIGRVEQGGSGGGGRARAEAPKQEVKRDLPDSLSRSMVQRTIRRYNAQINQCSSGSNSNNLTGSATVRFVVEGSGNVSSAQIQGEFQGTDVGSCIEGVVKGMRFPETLDSSRTINYPFRVR